MSETGKAVFLSYASQDGEAVARIAEALRAAGVEVWFDRNELTGGDAWDAKIRRQIKECALFVPVISANTDARPEGYFRLEWLLAVERARLMADDHPFLFPIAIGDVNDAKARVPEKFRDVQWTRVRLDETPAELAGRLARLLAGEEGGSAVAASAGVAGRGAKASADAAKPARGVWWWRYFFPVVGTLMGIFWMAGPLSQRRAERSADRVAATPVPASREAPSAAVGKQPALPPARELLAKAWVQLNTQELARAELETAETLCKRAAELDPVDAEVWATWTHVHAWYIYHALDAGAARKQAVRDCAAKALRLDPASFEVRLAQAMYQTRGGDGGSREQIAAALRELRRERPEDPRVLLLLGRHLMARQETHEEGLATLEKLAENPRFTALAWVEIGWAWFNRDRNMGKALAAADRSIEAKPFWHNLGLKAQVVTIWLGDFELALSTALQMPLAARQEDWAATLIDRIYRVRRTPDARVRFLQGLPQEWLSSHQFVGPKAALLGQARLEAGATEAGRRDLTRAIELIDRRLGEEPNDAKLVAVRAECQWLLGDEAGARASYALVLQLDPRRALWAGIRIEPAEKILDVLEADPVPWAWLNYEPLLDPLRGNPRFIALLEKTKNDPALSPHVPATGAR